MKMKAKSRIMMGLIIVFFACLLGYDRIERLCSDEPFAWRTLIEAVVFAVLGLFGLLGIYFTWRYNRR